VHSNSFSLVFSYVARIVEQLVVPFVTSTPAEFW